MTNRERERKLVKEEMHSCRNCFMESMNDIYNITFIYLIFTRNKHRVDGQFHVELTFAFENLDYY